MQTTVADGGVAQTLSATDLPAGIKHHHFILHTVHTDLDTNTTRELPSTNTITTYRQGEKHQRRKQ